MKRAWFVAAVLMLTGACASYKYVREDYTRYVNPFIGCADNGHTFPGAAYPFGLIQASPDTGNGTWAYCSGYMYHDTKIWGFSQTHLSGTGCPDLGDVSIQPFSGTVDRGDFHSNYRKETQQAKPGYYAVTLDDFGVDVKVTASPHVAFYNCTYNRDAPARLLVDLQYGVVGGMEHLHRHILQSDVTVENGQTISGHARSSTWVDREYYFVIALDRPFTEIRELTKKDGDKAPKYILDFDIKPGETLKVKIALSSVSVDGAKRNLAAEVSGWNFGSVRAAAKKAWNSLLGRMELLEGTAAQKENFYTSLYHLFIQPNNIADVDGQYRGADNQVRTAPGKAYYSTFSLWDTYRAAHPLYTIIAPEYVGCFVNNMVAHQQAKGYVPIWTLWGKENHCMIGNHSVPVIVDAYFKGFKGFDPEAAYAAIRESLTKNHPGHPKDRWDLYDQYGYYPFDHIRGESVSRTLECAYDDWCMAQFAAALGKTEDAAFFGKRAQNYRNVFDPSVGFMRGKDSKGNWREPFDPFKLGHGAGTPNDFTEGNSWQYTWHVMQDPEGLVALLGGKQKFGDKLDSLFRQASKIDGMGFVSDVSGLIGQYAHGNEPSHHVAYFFNYADRAWRTEELIREIFDTQYKNGVDGLCGNDDCGQMSAWYLFSAMGFYPFNPCNSGYVLGAPQMPKVRLNLGLGKSFTVVAKNLSGPNKYVQSVTLNGQPLQGFKLSHDQIIRGGELVFEMGPQPKK
ncbi:MAG: GH92 family glycosyl hydrolase [Kiritimatiellae bacterium]|nr:GH92 family glycosyl hydrolase [Kiritimatiellia bacterium]